MKVHIVFRSTGGDGKASVRPEYFSKLLGLKSFLLSVKAAKEDVGDILFLNDGDMPNDRLDIMHRYGNVQMLPGLGNSGSLRKAIEIVRKQNWAANDLVYFAEDDYLYRENAISLLYAAAEDIRSADYFTLYDHPDRYYRQDDAGQKRTRIFLSRHCHWRTVESTCITFGARLNIFKKDYWLFKLATMGKIPKDRKLFRSIQGIGAFWWKFPKRKLISPIPSGCSHMEQDYLAHFVDWETVARRVKEEWG